MDPTGDATGDMVEVVQGIITRARTSAISAIMQDGGLHAAMRSSPEAPQIANGVMLDGEFTEVCLFDDADAGFDDSERGFGP